MIAKGGSHLLQESPIATLIIKLLSLVFVLTPNIFNVEIISGMSVRSVRDAEKAAAIIFQKGPKYILIKGRHLSVDKAIDILYDGKNYSYYEAERKNTTNKHGTGCTLSATITAGLAKGRDVKTAIRMATVIIRGRLLNLCLVN